MMVTTEPTTHRHRVGYCPACNVGLIAEVDIVVEVGKPWLDEGGKARVNVTPKAVAMRFSHECSADDEDEQ